MSKYILGIDAGGTKTHGTLVDSSGAIVALATNGGANWERFGVDGAVRVLNETIDSLLQQISASRKEIASATFALAGIDWPEDISLFANFKATLGFSNEVSIVNDSFGALYAGAPTGIGIVSIAGTGGKTAGCNGTLSLQTMGMELGEGGGGGQLISLAAERIAEDFHSGKESSPLSSLIIEKSGKSTLLEYFYSVSREGAQLSENLAPGIFNLALSGDLDAAEIVAQVAHRHALDVIAIGNRLNIGSQFTVIRSGGLHTAGNSIFDEAFESTLTQAPFIYTTKILEISPSYGSVIHASHDFFGKANEEFNRTLLAQALERGHQ